MSITVLLTVLAAAVLHASWNALVKGGLDKRVSMAAIVFGHVPPALLILLFVPLPAPASWPYLVASMLLHSGYQLFLLQAYRLGDLTQVYPIARGSAPVMVMVVSMLFLGVDLQPVQVLAVLVIGTGILLLGFGGNRGGGLNHQATLFAVTTGVFIASYSLVDGLGARLAGTAFGFYSCMTLGNSIIILIWFGARAPAVLPAVFRQGRFVFVWGGLASFLAYALVTWAFTQAPIALVTALRETSIVCALVLGVLFLNERLTLLKIVSTLITLGGVLLLRLGPLLSA